MEIPFTYVAQGNLSLLRNYLVNGVITITDERGNTFLHLAVKYNQTEIFQYLIENYIDINSSNADGETPMMLCVYYNRIGFLKTLIQLKADHTKTNKQGETPFYKACFLGRGLIVSLFMENKMNTMDCKNVNDEDIYFALLRSQNTTLLDVFAKKNKDFYLSTNYFKDTLLHIAVKLNSLSMVEYLLEYHVFVNAKNKAKETPIFYAAKNGNREILSVLVSRGALLDLVNSYDETIYDVVEYQAFSEYITEKENSIEYRDYIKQNPLHVAIIKEDLFLIEQNLKKSEVEKPDIFGYKPMDLAYALGNKEIAKKIKEKINH